MSESREVVGREGTGSASLPRGQEPRASCVNVTGFYDDSKKRLNINIREGGCSNTLGSPPSRPSLRRKHTGQRTCRGRRNIDELFTVE